MKRRSIGGFVTGLIGIVLAVPIFILAWYIITFVVGLSLSFSGKEVLAEIIMLVTMFTFPISVILAIVGVCFYFKKARVGGLLMLIATLLALVPFILAFIGISGTENNTFETLIPLILYSSVGNIPTLLMFISAILGLCSKATAKISPDITPNEQTPIA